MNYDEKRMIPGQVVAFSAILPGGGQTLEEHWLSPGRRFSISLYATNLTNISLVVREQGRVILPLTTTHFQRLDKPQRWPELGGLRAYECPLSIVDMRALRDAYVYLFTLDEKGSE